MAVVRYVAFYPPTGFPNRGWDEDPACDALVKTGRRVAESLSREIAQCGLVGKSSEVRVFVRPAPSGQEHVEVDVHLDYMGGFETAIAHVPKSVEALSPQARAEVAFEVLLAALRTLGPHRGWESTAIDDAVEACRRTGLEFVWHSPWKAKSNRRQEARATFWLEDHGYGRTVLEVRDRGTEDTPVRSSAAVAFCTAAGFERSAKTLRWQGDVVTMEAEIGLLGSAGDRMVFDPSDGATDPDWVPPAQVGSGSTLRPEVRVAGSTYVPSEHAIRFVGGGPTNGVPRAYTHGLSKCFDDLAARGAAWWSGSDRTLLEILFNITEAGEPKVGVRRLKDRVSVHIYRPVDTFSLLNGGSLAREDANAVAVAVAKRMGLGEPPAL